MAVTAANNRRRSCFEGVEIMMQGLDLEELQDSPNN